MTVPDFYKQPTLIDLVSSGSKSPHDLPREIGGYPIESLFGRGGMSVLYLATHPETGDPLVIKVLSSDYVSSPEMVRRFMKEAEIIELTNHPNIIQLYGHGTWEGGVYIAMELVQGISLRQMILQQAMTLKRSMEVVLQIGHALSHLHAHGIIHRDLKPENIILTAEGGVKVIDFGISQIFSESEATSSPGKRRVIGTPAYMSPEQKQNPQMASFSSDIYSLGIIAYELVLGRLSFGSIHISLLPKGIQPILSQAMQPEIKNRYEDIIDFLRAVSRYMNSDKMEDDMRGHDHIGEMSDNLKDAQTFLVPETPPVWPRIDIALASNHNCAISAVYYDFFSQKDGVYTVVIGEALASGIEGLLYIAILRGMIRSLSSTTSNPKELVSMLNQQLMKENNNQSYSLSLLTLVPSENKLSFIACGYSPLWHLPAGSEVPRRIMGDNLALGIDPTLEVMEVSANWSIGDTLVMHTFQAQRSADKNELKQEEGYFLDALKDNRLLPPQKQVDAMFRRIVTKESQALFDRPVTLISLKRTS